jgi:hypothetical protein
MSTAIAPQLHEWRLQERPEPDLAAVRVAVLCLVDHEDRERQKYHTFNVPPTEVGGVIDHWRHKYPETLGWRNHQFLPTLREVPKGFDDRLYDKVGAAPWWLEKLGYRENTNFALTYRASATLTNALEALGSSSTFLAGYESATYDNTSNNDIDVFLSGTVITNGTTNVTVNTRIELNIVTEIADGTWPDVFDGTTSAETVTSQGIKDTCMKRLCSLNVDAVTQNRAYPYVKRSTAALFGGFAPSKFVVFTTHNTGQNLHATVAGTTTSKGLYITGT